MGNNGVKGIVLIALLVVVSFIIGSQISSDKMVSFGIIGAMVGGFTLLYLGERSWWLLFIVPLFWGYLGIRLPEGLTPQVVIAIVLLAYWLIMRIMGHVELRWRSMWLLDSCVFTLFCYTLWTFYRHPASVNWLQLDDVDRVGGKGYMLCFLGTIAYLGVSILPLRLEQLRKALRVCLNIYAVMLVFNLLRAVLSGKNSIPEEGEEGLLEKAKTTRFTLLTPLGSFLLLYIYASTPIVKIFSNFKKLALIFLGGIGVLLSGWRGTLIVNAMGLAILSFLKKELTFLIIIGSCCYGMLFYLSEEKVLEDLPFGVQRSLRAIPGIHVSRNVEKDANGSSEWRITMWKWALDSRTGYIKDYIWGDGFGQSSAWTQRYSTALMRGTVTNGDQQSFASQGIWHSGWITTIHRLGLVGLVILVIYQLAFIYTTLKTALALKRLGSQDFAIFSLFYVALISGHLLFHLSAGTLPLVYVGFAETAIIKLFYCSVREAGLLRPLFRRESYVPLTIREIEANNGLRNVRPAIEAPQA